MQWSLRRYIQVGVTVVFIAVVALYGFYQSNTFLEGPVITLEQPDDGTITFSSQITLEGSSKHISRIFLNDRQIFLDEFGRFDEELLLLPGYTIISLRAEDKFGREVEQDVRVVYRDR